MTARNKTTNKTVGFIVNPVAGMGGAVGLKGTDGKTIFAKAISLGAKPIASQRAKPSLPRSCTLKKAFDCLLGQAAWARLKRRNAALASRSWARARKKPRPRTHRPPKEMVKAGVDLLVFCGGDGTARDVLKAVGMKVPVLGVPTGVKMHSAVFAVTPQAAARVALGFLWGGLPLREAEVMDIDEEAFRAGHLSAELYGYMLSPYEPHLIQGNKLESPMTENEVRNQAAIAVYIIEEMKPDTVQEGKRCLASFLL